VLRLAVPSILANITIPLVGIVDVAIIGHISNASAVGGIAVGTMLFDLLYWNFGFLRVGTSGLTAQAYGRGDMQGATNLLSQGLTTALLASLLIWAIQWFFLTLVLALVPCSPEVSAFAREYFFIRIWAAPATLALMAFKGWFIGMQNTLAPMITDIVVNVVNMVASYFLAVHTMIGAIGVAWGTILAQYTGLLTAVFILFFRYSDLPPMPSGKDCIRAVFAPLRKHADTLSNSMPSIFSSQFNRVNTNLFFRSLCFMVVYVGYTSLASLYGDTELAVSALLMKFFLLFSYFVDGFAYAGEALVGRYGATPDGGWHRSAYVTRITRVLFMWALALGVLFSVLYAVGATPLLSLLTTDAALIAAARPYYIWLALMPLVSSLAFMWDGVFFGATLAVPVRNCMIWAAAAFVLAYLIFSPFIGIQTLYLGYFLHLITRTIYLSILWTRTK